MKHTIRTSVALSLLAVLAACTAETQNNKMVESKADTNNVQAAAETPVVNVKGKTSAPITMQYQILNAEAKVGEEISIQLAFNSQLAAPISVDFTVDNSLNVLTASKLISVMEKSGKRSTIPSLKVVAATEGVFYVRLIARIENNGKMMAKSFVIPVRVGTTNQLKTNQHTVETDENGDAVIVQPAEVINNQ